MPQLSSEETLFFRNLYSVLSDPHISVLLEKYAKMKYNDAVSKVTAKNDTYDYGYLNGQIAAWKHLIDLKSTVVDIIKR